MLKNSQLQPHHKSWIQNYNYNRSKHNNEFDNCIHIDQTHDLLIMRTRIIFSYTLLYFTLIVTIMSQNHYLPPLYRRKENKKINQIQK